jgi:hypothetical protein
VTIEWLEYPLYSELRVSGRVRVDDWVGTAELPPPSGSRLLVDYGELEGLDVSIGQLIAAAEELAAAGVRSAFVAPREPAVLALVRKAMILSRAVEGRDVAIFGTREECEVWLLSAGPGGEQ